MSSVASLLSGGKVHELDFEVLELVRRSVPPAQISRRLRVDESEVLESIGRLRAFYARQQRRLDSGELGLDQSRYPADFTRQVRQSIGKMRACLDRV